MILIKRVYLPAEAKDGERFLVDRLWPRGIKKEKAKLADWVRDVAPSNELRNWFGHDPKKWDEFQKRYKKELAANRAALRSILAVAKKGTVTLLFAAKDVEHNNAVVLKNYLKSKVK